MKSVFLKGKEKGEKKTQKEVEDLTGVISTGHQCEQNPGE